MGKARLLGVLDEAGVSYELTEHERTERALLEAEALGVDPADVAKTLVVSTPQGYVRAVVPASCRLDLHKLRKVIRASKQTRLATEEALERDYPEFELGAVPPLGGKHVDPVIVDTRTAERESVLFEAGTHVDSVRMKTADLLRITDARVADICQDQ